MAYSIERDNHSPELAKITLWQQDESTRFVLLMPFADLKKQRGREVITAWALGIATIPGSGIAINEVQNLIDLLDTINGNRMLLHPPRCRQW